ncbi:sugar ABC transporter ATP-binding protein [Agrobacterium genomosp. 3]|uniref:sugar ABC transporter ATP-binding protein n=1 Tax=Agrobacterium tomkonis TaxID=1183410 RepID=UPI001CD905C5|nr:sugar ABC transporter ATP-binding protein [Agrobacterium tomkonis]MCA1879659.1 sugar ABC transporter ATP-binding protein [Agrobacterium tumefaciens]MCA1894886.1 sugar ABC transporter ATP-binding protein [Agrobacterium tomkonis]
MPVAEAFGADEAVLRLRGLNKRFGGTQAVSDVGFAVGRGEIVALLGENGAGKSTLIKMLAGVYPADTGEFLFEGQAFDPRQGHPGIAFIHQDLGLIEWMTVAENISLMQGAYPRRFGLIDWPRVRHRAVSALTAVSDTIDPDARVQDLTRTEKSLVAIARALSRDARLLVLDEPTASLPQSDVEMLHAVLGRLRKKGVAMIYVSHRLDEVFAIADRVVVLRDGYLVGDEPIDGLDGESLIRLIIGRNLGDVFVHAQPPVDSPRVLRLEKLRTEDVGPVSFDLHKGEVLGLVGLRGAGQDAVGHALFGRSQIVSGRVLLEGDRPFQASHPEESIRQGICMVAGDRNSESVAPGLSIQENLFLNPGLTGRNLFSVKTPSEEATVARQIGRTFDIRPNDPFAPIETLSGGNQQKVVMARWMTVGGRVLILEDPTAGVDVGSKADIYALLAHALREGLAVILISTDFEEVAALSHRACVFRDGRIVAELGQDEISVEMLLNAASLEPAGEEVN